MELSNFDRIVLEELVPACGCTEPIALAFAAALARETLGKMPERANIRVSGNVIKNVKSVTIPNSNGMKGILPAVFLGIAGGNSSLKLETLSQVGQAEIELAQQLMKSVPATVEKIADESDLVIDIELYAGREQSKVRVAGAHTNVTHLSKNDTLLVERPDGPGKELQDPRDELTITRILDYIQKPVSRPVREAIQTQIQLNSAISAEGLQKPYGANVGRLILGAEHCGVAERASARAAAGSDARMSGSTMPVVINSGSGNQGLTVSMPVIEFAETTGKSEEELIRALLLSNLVSVRIKSGMGKLSAFCGAVSAACGSGAAVCYLSGGSQTQIENTIAVTLAVVAGMICDGAKASCAAKVASAVQAAFLAKDMALRGIHFNCGDGLVSSDIESTIDNYVKLAAQGMQETDEVILDMMVRE